MDKIALDETSEPEVLPLTRFQALFVEYLITGGKRGLRHSLRAMTRRFTTRYSDYTEMIGVESDAEDMNIECAELIRDGILKPFAEGSTENQILGMELVYRAGQILGRIIEY